MSFIKAGGWMKFRRKKAFTMIESIIYIFLSTIILGEGISMFISGYASYIEVKNKTIRLNEYRNFQVNLEDIVSEGAVDEIITGEDYVELHKNIYEGNMKKTIRVYNGNIVVSYSKGQKTLNYNNLLYNVSQMKVIKKENLIYLNIYDENGENFICCL